MHKNLEFEPILDLEDLGEGAMNMTEDSQIKVRSSEMNLPDQAEAIMQVENQQ